MSRARVSKIGERPQTPRAPGRCTRFHGSFVYQTQIPPPEVRSNQQSPVPFPAAPLQFRKLYRNESCIAMKSSAAALMTFRDFRSVFERTPEPLLIVAAES